MAWEKGCGLSHINNKYLSSLIVRHCRHTSFDCTSLYCAPQILCFFTSQRFVETLCQANLSVPFFPTAFAHFLSLCHILVILTIFKKFSLLYLLWWSVSSDLWYYYSKKIMTSWRFRCLLALFRNNVFYIFFIFLILFYF